MEDTEEPSSQHDHGWIIFPRTMFLSFVIVVYWCLVYTILGSIVLASVPTFRVTVLNVVAFVFGAWLGTYVWDYSSAFLFEHFALRLGPLERYPVASSLIGAAAVGVLFVWLKLRFIKSSDERRLL